ncbi:MAG: Ig-like domain-containing protein, partial [Gemmatimonas sp.]
VLRNGGGTIITKPVQWSSSNTAVASVSQSGVVTAVRPGQVQIVAETDQVLGASTVTVTEIPIVSCSLSPLTQKVTVNGQTQPSLTIRDSTQAILTLAGRAITWQSDNEVVAVVTQTGLVSARRAGTARIVALSTENPSVSCFTMIEAVDPRVDKVVIQQRTGSLRIGIPRGLTVAVLDSVNNLITGRQTNWTSVTPGIASVSSAGVVTGIALGTARIAVNVEGAVDTVSFAVTKVPVTSVRTSPLQVNLLLGETRQLGVTVTDSTGTIVTDRPVEWISNNPSIASVTQAGVVRALGIGSVLIQAISENSVGQSTVNVLQVPIDTILAPPTFTLFVGQTSGFTITVRDINGVEQRNRLVSAISDLPSIAQVPPFIQSSTVTVSAFSVGEALITLQAVNASGQSEGKATVVRVIVTRPPTPDTTPPDKP